MNLNPKISFIASSGDQIDRNFLSKLGASENSIDPHEIKYACFFAPDALRSVPFAPVVGNHDAITNYAFLYHFNLPNEQDFTSVDTGQSGSRHEM
jgi:hypothetical protein